MVNFLSGTVHEVFLSRNITDIYAGRIAEHVVGQELTSLLHAMTSSVHFWTREKDADAEVDFIHLYNNKLIPVEVKSGAKGHLRSLHEFIDRADHPFGVRIYANTLKVEKGVTRSGKEYHLLNLPFYLVHKIDEYLKWFCQLVG